MNYFELFELPEAPVADKAAVAKKYFELQKKYHPDFFTNENEADREDALQKSADINKAYTIFLNEDKTIEYFLRIKEVVTTDEKYNLPPDFLMEMMELNESMDDDETAMKTRVDDFEKSLKSEAAPLLQPRGTVNFTEEELQRLKSYYYRKKYLRRVLERLDD